MNRRLNVAKLSQLQRDILKWLYARHVKDGSPANGGRIRWAVDGDALARAAMSRALRRLEERDLLLRRNFSSGMGEKYNYRMRLYQLDEHNRTTHITLLPDGVEIGKLLTNGLRRDVNRSDGARGVVAADAVIGDVALGVSDASMASRGHS
jgi:hypothetical protein